MNATKAVLSVLSVLVSFAALRAQTAEPKPAGKMPALRVDTSPLGGGPAPVVASYAETLDTVRPAVVSIYSTKLVRQRIPDAYRQLFGNIPDRTRRLSGLGSGVLVSADGYILTNNHVVEEADELEVQLGDERRFPAKLVGNDPKTDIAVIKIEATELPHVTLADSDKLRVGDVVFALGNPLNIGQTVTMGIVSATGRKNVNLLTDRDPGAYEDFIQTDAAINFGNSGGALVDARGRLVGVNSGIATNNQGNIGIGFAVPVNLARSIMRSLIETGTVVRGYMGVSTEQLTPDLAESFGLKRDQRGVIVLELSPEDGPAAQAGLKPEDIITEVDGKPVSSREDLRLMIAQTPPGTKVEVKYLRNGKPGTATVTLTALEDESAPSGELLPGVSVEPITEQLRRDHGIDERIDGVIVTDVSPASRYAGIFPEGSVIESINRSPVTDLASAKRALVPGTRNRALLNYRGLRRYVLFEAP
ncbi:MAG TPA: Do family serine endopeptidase [Opitutaceae bacterium]|nr:Do family serine endopeptidase [Opitutaceae bacterium]